MPRPIYDDLARMSKAKLDSKELEHNLHFEKFSNVKDGKAHEVQSLSKRLDKLRTKARKQMEESVPNALATAMEMRHVNADLLIAKSVMSVIRSNQFYHRLMMMLIQDIKAGVQYDPNRVKELVPAEFSEMVDQSIISTNMEGVLAELRSELDQNLEGGE